MIARWTEAEVQTINSLRSQAQLLAYQAKTGINLAQLAYYVCGFEWYIRNSPPTPLDPMNSKRVAMYQARWLEWNRSTGAQFDNVSFLMSSEDKIDDPDCSSFVDILD